MVNMGDNLAYKLTRTHIFYHNFMRTQVGSNIFFQNNIKNLSTSYTKFFLEGNGKTIVVRQITGRFR